MHFKFWGVRGSIPAPGPKTVHYGGNTTCIEVRGDNNELLILDGGTGIFPLGQSLVPEFPLKVHIFITHTHWDHIQGLPMFLPIFVPGNEVTIHGAADPITQRDIGEVLARQMEYAYFPVREAELNANMSYLNIQEGQGVQVGGVNVQSMLLNHPVLNFGYRLECNGKVFVFTGDHEWPYNIYNKDDPDYPDYQQMVDEQRSRVIDFFRDADVLVIDTAYTDAEYPSRKGWGHGTFASSIEAAREAGVKRVFLTHHEPTRSDADLEAAFDEARKSHDVGRERDPQFELAREGVMIEV
ncbi:MAG: MBL fold metallo-hydrolase [Candidatus Thiodiazotropha lotti]|nr:MBL fold metallo-hydrolase [Candidatus Thiodiazotropha lotti]